MVANEDIEQSLPWGLSRGKEEGLKESMAY